MPFFGLPRDECSATVPLPPASIHSGVPSSQVSVIGHTKKNASGTESPLEEHDTETSTNETESNGSTTSYHFNNAGTSPIGTSPTGSNSSSSSVGASEQWVNLVDVIASPLKPFQIKFTDQAGLENTIKNYLWDMFGIRKLTLKDSKNLKSEPCCNMCGPFTLNRFEFVCGDCKPAERAITNDQLGCCGLNIKGHLVKPPNNGHYYLEIYDSTLPTTSRHSIIDAETKHELDGAIKHKAELERLHPGAAKLLKSLGRRRARAHMVRSVMKDTFPDVQISKHLMWGTLKAGRDEAYGKDDDTSMVHFLEMSMKNRSNGGTFAYTMCASTSELVMWTTQCKLELLIAKQYGRDIYFMDTTFNATKFVLKTGPVVSVDCFGLSAPCGLFQVPEEESDAIDQVLTELSLDVKGAGAGTDGEAVHGPSLS